MSPHHLLTVVDIATPCHADWDSMTGDERSRFCGQCRKHVYNLSAMPASEAVDLIRSQEGDLCIRMYRRNDGTVLNGDCPVGVGTVWRRTKRLCAAVAAAGVLVVGAKSAPAVRTALKPEMSPVVTNASNPGTVSQTWREWTAAFKEWLGFSSPTVTNGPVMGRMVMGEMALPPGWTPAPPPVDNSDIAPPPPAVEPNPD